MRTILLGLISLAVIKAAAQDTVELKLSDAVESAVKNNSEVALALFDKESAAAKFGQTNAVFLPQINLSYTALTTDNPLNAFGFKLQHQSVSPADFNPQVLNNPSSTQNFATKVELNQPILNLDLVWQRRAASQQVDVYHYKAERTKQFVTFEVTKTFSQLQLAQEAVDVLKESLLNADSILAKAEKYFAQGLLQKSDLLLIKVQVAAVESKLEEARNNIQNACEYLSLLMGVKDGPVYSVEPLERYDAANLTSILPENRADLNALKSAVKAQEILMNSARMAYLPKLNAFGNYMFNDESASGFGSGSYLIGAQLSWSLFNGTTSYHKTAEQKIARDKIEEQLSFQKEQSQLELNKAWRQLGNTRFDLQQHETTVAQAAEAFRIRNDRFRQGLVSATDLLQSQTVLSEQKLLFSEAVFKHNTTLAYIQFLTTVSENK